MIWKQVRLSLSVAVNANAEMAKFVILEFNVNISIYLLTQVTKEFRRNALRDTVYVQCNVSVDTKSAWVVRMFACSLRRDEWSQEAGAW